MAVLDTSGAWTAGDEYRVLDCLGMPVSQYTVDGIIFCMNSMADALAARVVADLTRYEAAKQAQTAADVANTAGTVLTRADVLEYQYIGGAAGTGREMSSAASSVRLAFGSCPYVSQTPYGGATTLIRS